MKALLGTLLASDNVWTLLPYSHIKGLDNIQSSIVYSACTHKWNVIGYTKYNMICHLHVKAWCLIMCFNQLNSYFYSSHSFFVVLLSLADHSYWWIWEQEAIQVCLCQHETKGRSKWLVLEYYTCISLLASCGDVERVHSVCGQEWLSWWFAKRSRKWGTPLC